MLAVACWSTVATGFKLGLRLVEPIQLLLLGTLVSTLVFWCAALPGARYRLSVKSIGIAALAGAMNPCAYYVVLFEAYDRLPAQIAQPLNYTWAVAMALLAWPILGQRPTWRALGGILLSYAGVVILLSQGQLEVPSNLSGLGVALALGSTLIWAGYWLMNTRIDIDPVGLMAWSFLFGSAYVGALCLLGPGLPPASLEVGFYGLWVGLIEMGITFLVWQRALRLTRHAGRIGQLIFLSPFLSFLLIGTVLGETIHTASLAGLAVIVAGLLVARPKSTGSAPNT